MTNATEFDNAPMWAIAYHGDPHCPNEIAVKWPGKQGRWLSTRGYVFYGKDLVEENFHLYYMPPADTDTVDGLTIHEWKNRALTAQNDVSVLMGTRTRTAEARLKELQDLQRVLGERNHKIEELKTEIKEYKEEISELNGAIAFFKELTPEEQIQNIWATAHKVPENTEIPADTPMIERSGTYYGLWPQGRHHISVSSEYYERRTLQPLPAITPEWSEHRHVWATTSHGVRTIYTQTQHGMWHSALEENTLTTEQIATRNPKIVTQEP